MSEHDTFILCGGAVPPIGFGTPVFIRRTSNSLWAQSINAEETVTDFIDVEEAATQQVTLVIPKREQRIGSPALFLYADVTGNMQIGTRLELEPMLRDDFQLAGSPRVKRSIARFLNEPGWIAEAERELDARRKQRAKLGTRLGSSILIRGVFHDALRAALSGSDVMIRGGRGSGKTVLLMWLAKVLREQHGGRIIGPLRAGPFQLEDPFLAQVFPSSILEAQRRPDTGHKIDISELVEELSKFVDSHDTPGRTYFIVDDVDIFDSARDILGLLAMVRQKTRTQFSIISASPSIGETKLSYWNDEVVRKSAVQLALEPLSPAEAVALIEMRAPGAGQDGLVDRIGLKEHAGRHLPRSLLAAMNASADNPPASSREFERLMMEYYDLALDRSTDLALNPSTLSDPPMTRADVLESTFRLLNALAGNNRTEQLTPVVLSKEGNDLAVARMLRNIGIIAIDDRGYVSFSHAWFRDWWRSKARPNPTILKSGMAQRRLFDDKM